MRMKNVLRGAGLAMIGTLAMGAMAMAQDVGVPEPWGLGYQPAATEVASRQHGLTAGLHWVAFGITLFVTVLLAYTCWRFSEKRNPEAKRFSHNTAIEVAWTVVPVVILVAIAVPSIRYLYFQETVPPAGVTVKAIGKQWYWTYEYELEGETVSYDSYMAGGQNHPTYEVMKAAMENDGASPDEIPPEALWKLKTDAPMVVPVDTNIRVQVTAEPTGVLHAFAMPSFGVKADAVPARLNELWFEAKQIGTFYGQCSELCGPLHAYMPIEVQVVSRADFESRLSEVAGLKPKGETKLADAADTAQ